jgi:hypothetical protein
MRANPLSICCREAAAVILRSIRPNPLDRPTLDRERKPIEAMIRAFDALGIEYNPFEEMHIVLQIFDLDGSRRYSEYHNDMCVILAFLRTSLDSPIAKALCSQAVGRGAAGSVGFPRAVVEVRRLALAHVLP